MVERISELRKLEDLSQKDFARTIHISQAALSQIESGKTSIAMSTLYSIIDKFNVNADWILFGRGEMYKEKQLPIAHGTPIHNKSHGESNLISYVTKDAEAGYLEQYEDEEYIKSLDGFRLPGFEDGEYRMFQISGNSMEPSLFEDEIVVVEKIEKVEYVQANRQCVIVTKEGVIAKRVFPQKDNKLLLKSDNPKFKSFTLDHKLVIEIWEIKAKITAQFLSPPLSGQASDDIDRRIETLENTVNQLTIALRTNSENGSRKN